MEKHCLGGTIHVRGKGHRKPYLDLLMENLPKDA